MTVGLSGFAEHPPLGGAITAKGTRGQDERGYLVVLMRQIDAGLIWINPGRERQRKQRLVHAKEVATF